MVSNSTRDANPARLRKSLQAGRDIYGVAEEIVALHDDVANMDADPEPHLLIDRSIRIRLRDRVLHLNSTLHGINGAGEIGKNAVACRGEDPTAMRGDQPIDDDPVSRERAERADLIEPHQAAVALDIRGEDRGELPLDRVRFQGSHLPARIYLDRVRDPRVCKPF